jgi:hypothetical protein
MQPELKVRAIERQQEQVSRLEQELAAINRRPTPSKDMGLAGRETDFVALGKQRAEAAAKKKSVAEAKAKLKQIKADPLYLAWPPLLEMKVGELGVVVAHAMKVRQVMDGQNVLVEFWMPAIEREYQAKTVWMTGVDTTNLIDDDLITYDRPIMFTRTHRHFGSTYLYAEPLPWEDYLEVVEEPAAVPAKPTKR